MVTAAAPAQPGLFVVPDAPTILETRRAEAARVTGIAAGAIEAGVLNSRLLDDGIFLDLDATGFGVVTTSLGWRTLGVEIVAGRAITIRPPRVDLVPHDLALALRRPKDEMFRLLNTRGRKVELVDALSGTSGNRWVHKGVYGEFVAAYETEQARLVEARDAILARYDELRDAAADAIRQQALAAAPRLVAAGIIGAGEECAYATPEAFAEAERAAFREAYPPREDFAAIAVELKTRIFQLGSEVEEERAARAEAVLRREAAERGERQLAIEAELAEVRRAAEIEAAKHRLIVDQEMVERAVAVERARLESQEAGIRKMAQEKAAALAREEIAPIRQFIRDDLAETATIVGEVLALVREKGTLAGSSADRLRDHVALQRAKAFYLRPEDTLSTEMDELERLLAERSDTARRDKGRGPAAELQRAQQVAAIGDSLAAINAICRQEIDAIMRPSTIARTIEL